MKKKVFLGLAFALAITALVGCGGAKQADKQTGSDSNTEATKKDDDKNTADAKDNKLTIAASPTPHAEILEFVKPILKEKGVDLVIKPFTDYVQPNEVVESGDIDCNYFQHPVYLKDFNEQHGTHIVEVAPIHYEPFGIYPGKKTSFDELKSGDIIAVPNDVTNEARALLLLQDNGIIRLKDGAGITATVKDIVENPKNIKFKEIEAAQIPRMKDEVALVGLTGNYAIQAGLNAEKDAIAQEKSDSEAAKSYANIVCVKEGNEKNPNVLKLVEVLKSPEVKKFIIEKYKGAVVPIQ